MKDGAALEIIKCARYTRKSTEHGLDQKFNSLEAQKDACDSYIRSQKSKGWVLIPEIYEDGGFTGANMERPGLQKLIEDIKCGKINVVVVYKHDRLTRSLMDFAKLIELFDEYDVSFVSVTEQFNTTDSSGRLFLNMLFSFAQYEREIAAERTRDKIAASKRKGIWMGGTVPLGYNAINKELKINEYEANIINFVFSKYIECNSTVQVAKEAQKLGYKTKERKTKSGVIGGKPLDKGTIYRILSNKTYIGKVEHKGQIYDGKHQPIVSQENWDKVHSMLGDSPRKKAINARIKTPALLTSVLKCGDCNSGMVPTYTKKGDKQYHYYKADNVIKKVCEDCPIGALPAGEVENLILDEVKVILQNPIMISKTWGQVRKLNTKYSEEQVYNALKNINLLWDELFILEKRRIIQSLISKVIVYPEALEIHITSNKISHIIHDFSNHIETEENDGDSFAEFSQREILINGGSIVIRLPITFKRKYKGRVAIITPADENEFNAYDETLVKAVVRAFKWWKQLEDNTISGIDEISKKEGINRGYISKILRITCLAPDIIYSILIGNQPKSLMLADLTKKDIPDDWQEQKQLYGFV